MEERSKLTQMKAMVRQHLIDNDFDLEKFSIEITEDDNHVAHLIISVLPEALKSDEEKDIDEQFKNIIGDL